MTRFITATLTLALITGLSSGKASAQAKQIFTFDESRLGVSMNASLPATSDFYSPDTVDELIAIIAFAATETGIMDPSDCPNLIDGGYTYPVVLAMNSLCPSSGVTHANDVIESPSDCPNGCHYLNCTCLLDGGSAKHRPDDCPDLGGQEGEDLVDLWFELVDAGYTEDEAFEMIEMVMVEGVVRLPYPHCLNSTSSGW